MILESIAAITSELATGVASGALYDFLKGRFQNKATATPAELQGALEDYLVLHKITARASTVMDLLAAKGILKVTQSNLHAPIALTVAAGPGATFSVGDNTKISTATTAIVAGKGAYIKGTNAAIRQNPDGSISFLTGGKK